MPFSAGSESTESRPYGPLRMAVRYCRYRLFAQNGRGHGIHSPFVFDFIKHVLNHVPRSPACRSIEELRKKLLADERAVRVEDFGAGSYTSADATRKVRSIAASALKPRKYAQLLHNMAGHYAPGVIIELGTSLGLTTAYLACGNPGATVYSIEGAPEVADIAMGNLASLGIENVRLFKGRFEDRLDDVLHECGIADLAFIDGNHRYEPTIGYFKKIRSCLAPKALVVFDDIHWSPGMERAWDEVCRDPSVSLTIDLFFLGIAVINPDILVKQHFTIRY